MAAARWCQARGAAPDCAPAFLIREWQVTIGESAQTWDSILDKKARIIFVRLEEVLKTVPDQEARGASTKRFHVVLVPGFAGFDGLGQLEYYGGIAPLFQTWLAGNEVLHYFDNFPTAAVVTRATQLRSYLAKRIARGEISIRDDVILAI